MQVQINPTWQKRLQPEFDQPYFELLSQAVKEEYQKGPVFPSPADMFRAFNLTDFDSVKVVILGQDPYHTPGVADGLAFSTKPGNRVPPSLQNIFKEIGNELYDGNYPEANNPDLTRWAEQGVLLLNNTLTVKAHQANSHKNLGWNEFTDAVIRKVARGREHVVFLLWGKFAQGKAPLIKEAAGSADKHLILTSPHPSPFSADRGFFGNNHFAQANIYLQTHGQEPIKW